MSEEGRHALALLGGMAYVVLMSVLAMMALIVGGVALIALVAEIARLIP